MAASPCRSSRPRCADLELLYCGEKIHCSRRAGPRSGGRLRHARQPGCSAPGRSMQSTVALERLDRSTCVRCGDHSETRVSSLWGVPNSEHGCRSVRGGWACMPGIKFVFPEQFPGWASAGTAATRSIAIARCVHDLRIECTSGTGAALLLWRWQVARSSSCSRRARSHPDRDNGVRRGPPAVESGGHGVRRMAWQCMHGRL